MYERLRVSGFRGIGDITLEKTGRLNILVGRNDTGKSACLEAVSLLASGPRGFSDAFGRSALEAPGRGGAGLLREGSKSAVVEGVRDGAPETLQIAGSPRDMEEPPRGDLGAGRWRACAPTGRPLRPRAPERGRPAPASS